MGRGKRHEAAVRGQLLPMDGPPAPTAAEATLTGGFFAVRVIEQDHDKSAIQLELDGGSIDNGVSTFGPYATEEEAEREAERARVYYDARKHINKYGELELDWRVEVAPWPKSCTVSDYVREQEARKQGVDPAAVDLRLVFDEPAPVIPPGERSRPSSLAERIS